VLELDFCVERRDLRVEVAFCVAGGQRVALVGPSGAGKTTVLETVAGLVRPCRGSVTLAGRVLTASGPPEVDVPVWLRRVGLLRQQVALFPHLSVAENLAYARRGLGTTATQDTLAESLGISSLLDEHPATLSGGQCQRVGICRLLLADVDALLFDEPFTGLDPELRRTVSAVTAEVVAARRLPTVLVAHELTEAQAFADLLGIVDGGRLLQLGAPHEVVRRPGSRRAAEIVGYRAFVDTSPHAVPCSTVLGVHPGRVVAGAHPDAGAVLHGTVTRWRAAGARVEVDLDVAGVTVACELEDRPPGTSADVTVLDPQWFSAVDGRALGRQSGGPAVVDPGGSTR
jgi:ABC-type sulfate/molybdate transport systems ATPase subunit